MIPTGKGMFLWRLAICANGDPALMVSMARAVGIEWVAIKAVDGTDHFNQGTTSYGGPNLLPVVVEAFKGAGISVWLWGYLYGATRLRIVIASTEAQRMVENIERFHPDGILLDAESEYKRSGSAAWADIYMNVVRAACPTIPIGLCSYRFPTLHPEVPWHNFLRRCNFHAPQVYWIKANNPGDQLRRSMGELQALANLPVIPVGCAYYDTYYKWQPTVVQLNEFDRVAHELNLPGITWWEWGENGHGAQYIAPFWEAISVHDWGQPPMPPQDWAHAMTGWARSMGYMGPEPG